MALEKDEFRHRLDGGSYDGFRPAEVSGEHILSFQGELDKTYDPDEDVGRLKSEDPQGPATIGIQRKLELVRAGIFGLRIVEGDRDLKIPLKTLVSRIIKIGGGYEMITYRHQGIIEQTVAKRDTVRELKGEI